MHTCRFKFSCMHVQDLTVQCACSYLKTVPLRSDKYLAYTYSYMHVIYSYLHSSYGQFVQLFFTLTTVI